MKRRSVLTLSAITALALPFLPDTAISQAEKPLKEQLVGSWTIVSVDNVRPDGSRTPTFGTNPKAHLVFDPSGRYSLYIARAGQPKFASNNRMEGTPEENKAVVQGLIAHFGRYSVNEADRSFTFHVESSSFPNWDGTEQKRPFSIAGDELKYANPVAGWRSWWRNETSKGCTQSVLPRRAARLARRRNSSSC
jgi:lipocalin-like protein